MWKLVGYIQFKQEQDENVFAAIVVESFSSVL